MNPVELSIKEVVGIGETHSVNFWGNVFWFFRGTKAEDFWCITLGNINNSLDVQIIGDTIINNFYLTNTDDIKGSITIIINNVFIQKCNLAPAGQVTITDPIKVILLVSFWKFFMWFFKEWIFTFNKGTIGNIWFSSGRDVINQVNFLFIILFLINIFWD